MSQKMTLSQRIDDYRTNRVDEWTMDELSRSAKELESLRGELLVALRISREAMGMVLAEGHNLSFGTGNALVSAIDISGEAIAKVGQS